MNDDVNYKNNPLHGLSLKNLLIELVDHYGFEILYAYLNINCFKTNPSIESSVKFLKKTEWDRHKVEVLYLYEFKNLPRASSAQFALPPRDRIIPDDQVSGAPAELSLDDAERLREKRERKAAEHSQGSRRSYSEKQEWKSNRNGDNSQPKSSGRSSDQSSDPWAKWKE